MICLLNLWVCDRALIPRLPVDVQDVWLTRLLHLLLGVQNARRHVARVEDLLGKGEGSPITLATPDLELLLQVFPLGWSVDEGVQRRDRLDLLDSRHRTA